MSIYTDGLIARKVAKVKPKHDKHIKQEEKRLQAVMAERALMVPQLSQLVNTLRRRIRQLEWQLEHRMERAIAVLRGEDD